MTAERHAIGVDDPPQFAQAHVTALAWHDHLGLGGNGVMRPLGDPTRKARA